MIQHILTILMGVLIVAPNPPHKPEGNDHLIRQMVALYDAAAQDINELAGRALLELENDPTRRASQFRQMRAIQMNLAIQQKLEQLNVQSSSLLKSPLETTVYEVVKQTDSELAKIGINRADAPTGAEIGFALIAGEAVEVIAADTILKTQNDITSSMRSSMEQHAQNAATIFRLLSESSISGSSGERSVNTAIARGLIAGNPTIADRAIRELFAKDSLEAQSVRKLGNKQIQVGKATMNVRQYAATVTRTRIREATVEGRHRRLQEKRGLTLSKSRAGIVRTSAPPSLVWFALSVNLQK